MEAFQRFPMTTPVDPDTIGRVYSGKPGCGCGCRGNYYTDTRNIRRVVNVINKRIGTGAGAQTDGDGKATIFFVEDRDETVDRYYKKAGRYYWAYAKGTPQGDVV